jgi:hypothetical protein
MDMFVSRASTIRPSLQPSPCAPASALGLFHTLSRWLWTLRLLEHKVVQLGIVERASDNTIGCDLKKTRFSLTARKIGSSRQKRAAHS